MAVEITELGRGKVSERAFMVLSKAQVRLAFPVAAVRQLEAVRALALWA